MKSLDCGGLMETVLIDPNDGSIWRRDFKGVRWKHSSIQPGDAGTYLVAYSEHPNMPYQFTHCRFNGDTWENTPDRQFMWLDALIDCESIFNWQM